MIVVGDVLQTPSPDELQHLADVAVTVDDDGTITSVGPRPDGTAAGDHDVVELGPGQFLLPGLVDLHVHAPQWPQLGTCLDLPLERWLFEHTFPLEARYAEPAFAAAVWSDLVRTLLRHGTTTAAYFGANDEASTAALASVCLDQGQRALVGRVAMDHPTGTPDWYRDRSAAAGVEAAARSIEAIRRLDAGRDLVRPIVTPRFAPACTDALLAGLGELATATGAIVQTHCSESDWAHGYSLERFGVTDTVALDRFGLLGAGTILAHANHVTDDDAVVLATRRAAIAHCPLSNAYFADAVLPARRLLDAGVPMGLGTDVAGGASPGLLAQCQHAVTMSRVRRDGVDGRRPSGTRGTGDRPLDVVRAFWLATAGGADAVGLPVGLLAPGRRFDAIVVDTAAADGNVRRWPGIDDEPALVFEKIVRLAGPTDVASVWVDGRRVV
jgi:guanine deaminase